MKIKKTAKSFALCFFACLTAALGCSCSTTEIFSGESSRSSCASSSSKSDYTGTTDIKTDYSYDALTSDSAKSLYMSIASATDSLYASEAIVDGKMDDYEIIQACEAFKNDHPEVFWLKSVETYTLHENSTSVKLSYTLEGDKLESARSAFNDKLDSVVSAAPESGAFAKEEYANDYIIDNCSYDDEATQSDDIVGSENDAYGALVLGKAVCEGYARAFQLLCNKLGIDCVTVSGTVDSGNHAWNCVCIGGDWYQTDVTWNDTDGEDEYSQNDYFNLTTEVISEDHTVSPLYSETSSEEYDDSDEWCNFYVPECTATEYNYYIYKYPTISDLDSADEVCNSIAESAANGEKYTSIVVDKSADFGSMCDEIIEGGYLAQWIETANEINGYEPELTTSCYAYRKDFLGVVTVELSY